MEGEEPNDEYVRLKLELAQLTAPRYPRTHPENSTRISVIRARLEEVKEYYFFSEKQAEAAFKARLLDEDLGQLHKQLKGESSQPQAHFDPPPNIPLPPQLHIPEHADNHTDVFDEAEEEDAGFFDLLEPMPDSEQNPSTGTIVTIRDMPITAAMTSVLPKAALNEFISKQDISAIAQYRDISGGTRAKRASVKLQWSTGRIQEWSMEDTACYDFLQAEQYVATVALYSLTNQPLPGFASKNLLAFALPLKRFPPAFRDLWNEFDDRRKEEDNATNYGIWSKLNDIIDAKAREKTVRLTTHYLATDYIVVFQVSWSRGFPRRTRFKTLKFFPGK